MKKRIIAAFAAAVMVVTVGAVAFATPNPITHAISVAERKKAAEEAAEKKAWEKERDARAEWRQEQIPLWDQYYVSASQKLESLRVSPNTSWQLYETAFYEEVSSLQAVAEELATWRWKDTEREESYLAQYFSKDIKTFVKYELEEGTKFFKQQSARDNTAISVKAFRTFCEGFNKN